MEVSTSGVLSMYRLLSTVLITLSLTACISEPSEDLISREVTEQLYERHDATVFELVNLEKVDVTARDDSTYIAEVKYDLRFKFDWDDAAEALQRQSGNLFVAGRRASTLSMKYGGYRAGDIIQRQSRVRFTRSDKGWHVDEAELES